MKVRVHTRKQDLAFVIHPSEELRVFNNEDGPKLGPKKNRVAYQTRGRPYI